VQRGHSVNQPEASRPGSILRAERETLGVSLREVAETLNLSMSVVRAIEADDLDKLPGAVFARGYLRAYARLLELDPEPLLRCYPRYEEPAVQADAPSEAPIWEWIRRRPALVLGSAGGLLVVVLVVLISLLWPGADSEDGAVATRSPDAAESVLLAPTEAYNDARPGGYVPSQEASGTASSAADRAAVPDARTNTPAPGGSAAADESAADESAADESAVAESAVAESTAYGEGAAAQLQTGGALRITRTGDDQLSFRFNEDCWLEVRSATGASLYSDLNRSGSQLELVGEGPFRILLGYAPGARLTFNGEPVPLAPHTRNNVATLVLGQ
jgi:cytoskeleton protein RodZ